MEEVGTTTSCVQEWLWGAAFYVELSVVGQMLGVLCKHLRYEEVKWGVEAS